MSHWGSILCANNNGVRFTCNSKEIFNNKLYFTPALSFEGKSWIDRFGIRQQTSHPGRQRNKAPFIRQRHVLFGAKASAAIKRYYTASACQLVNSRVSNNRPQAPF